LNDVRASDVRTTGRRSYGVPARVSRRAKRVWARWRRTHRPEVRAQAKFLESHRDVLHGRVLETDDVEWTRRFGEDRVGEASVVSINPRNRRATHIADLSEPGSLPAGRFDCVVLADPREVTATALQTALGALRPGGVLLASFDAARVSESSAFDALAPLLPADAYSVSTIAPLTTVYARVPEPASP
jgi:hypothetical protein